MRFLLIALVAFLTLSSVFGWDPGPAPGVKIKNAILYLLITALMWRVAVDRAFKIQLPAINAAFAVLIGYAILSYVAVVLVVQYPRYDVLRNAFDLKGLVDQMLIFLVFFYGVRSEKDALFLLKCIFAAFALSHLMAVLDALGIVHIGDLERRSDGRVQGLVGESNQYGAFVALTLPAMVSVAMVTRGVWRLLWGLAALFTALTLIMTVSRGAFVAVFVACLAGAVMFRRYLSGARATAWLGGAAAAVLVAVIIASVGYADLLYERLVGGLTGDLVRASSGRTEFWTEALGVMLQEPITLLTGFGWNAYWTMPFRYSPHNHYLSQWFNLGLPGLLSTILLLVLPARLARSAFNFAPAGPAPAILCGFVIATVAFGTATFFVDLYMPWLYFWAYAGLVMRIAVNVKETWAEPAPATAPPQALGGADPYGWIGTVRH